MNTQIGIISNWNEEKGFGFIAPKSGGREIFAHINDYSRIHKKPCKGLEVQYRISTDPRGRKCAVDVQPLKGHKNNGREVRQKTISIVFLTIFVCVLYFLFHSRRIPSTIIVMYAFMSILAFLMYAKDKSAAKRGRWRTEESTLHTVSLLGGWPGAAIAQSFLRHKSKKMSFRVTYWITVIVNCCVLYWLVTPKGTFWLKGTIQKIVFFARQALD